MKNSRVNELIQSLESRRLMSMTAGFDQPATAHAPSPDHIEHAFGFQQSAFAQDAGTIDGSPMSGQLGAQFGPPLQGGFFGASPDPAGLQSQMAHAIANGTLITVSPIQPVAGSNTTLSSLYSSLSTSTAIQIDTATLKSAASALGDSVSQGMHTDFTPHSTSASGTTTASVQAGFSATRDPVGLDSGVTSDKALAKAMSLVIKPISIVETGQPPAPSWATLRKLEDDLSTVRSLAGAMIAELGRDSAIALSHLESIVDSPATNRFVSSLASWRSAAALTGAVIATVAYSQSENDQKKKSVFSNRLISPLVR